MQLNLNKILMISSHYAVSLLFFEINALIQATNHNDKDLYVSYIILFYYYRAYRIIFHGHLNMGTKD